MKGKRFLFFVLWTALLLIGPFAVLKNTPLSIATKNDIVFVNFLQRVFGLLAFTMLFIQLTLGSFMDFFVNKLGGFSYKFHTIQGIYAYGVFLLHPLMQAIIDFKLSGPLAPLLTFLPGRDLFLNFGKIGLLLITLGVIAGYFRERKFFRRNWKKFHILNYFAFFFIGSHAWMLGTDVKTVPFSYLFWFAHAVIFFAVFKRFIVPFFRRLYPQREKGERVGQV